jgi:di/tricarboxylate transporter
MYVVFLILGVAALLFVSNRVRPDAVALLTVLALMLTNVLTPREALAGFGNPVVILVGCLLVVSAALTRTGVAHVISRGMARAAGDSETRMLVVVMLTTGLLGSVMNGTAVVAILIPAVLAISRTTGIHESRLLMPLSYAALISGMLTLIATTPNMVASAELVGEGHEGFDFFDFTPIGLTMLGVGVVYFVLVGRRLLPKGDEKQSGAVTLGINQLSESFGVRGKGVRLKVLPKSPLVDKSLREANVNERYRTWVIMVERQDRLGETTKAAPSKDFVLRANDVLVLLDRGGPIDELLEEQGLERLPSEEQHRQKWFQDIGLAVVLIHPQSRFVSRSLSSTRFHASTGLVALGLRRRGELVADFEHEELHDGDKLLLLGAWDQIGRLHEAVHDYVVLSRPAELAEVAPARRRMPAALVILAGMVVLSALEVVPVVVSVMLAAMAVVVTRCLTMADAYRAINWSNLVLIGGMLPAADAMEKTGGIDLIVKGLTGGLGITGPFVMMSVIFFITSALGLFFSGVASTVLMAPVAIGAATVLNVAPHAFVMAVAIGASAAFVTPFSNSSLTMVMSIGNYRFADFLKVGFPLLVLTWLVVLLVTPVIFGF